MKQEKYSNYRQFLMHELEDRVRNNQNYTIAEFCEEINVRHSRLTEILGGKLGLSIEKATDIAERLRLSAEETAIFVDLVQSLHGRGALVRKIASDRLQRRLQKKFETEIAEEAEPSKDIFSVVMPLKKYQLEHLLESISQITEEIKEGNREQESDYSFIAKVIET